MFKLPQSKTVTAPEKLDIEVIVGRKAAIHTKTTSANSCLVYLTQGDDPVAADYTMEIAVGALYEIPSEHSGEVWVGGQGGASDITFTQYG